MVIPTHHTHTHTEAAQANMFTHTQRLTHTCTHTHTHTRARARAEETCSNNGFLEPCMQKFHCGVEKFSDLCQCLSGCSCGSLQFKMQCSFVLKKLRSIRAPGGSGSTTPPPSCVTPPPTSIAGHFLHSTFVSNNVEIHTAVLKSLFPGDRGAGIAKMGITLGDKLKQLL